jgi:hypothetical protein
MRWLAVVIAAAVSQAPVNLPPAYPRAGATKILDNEAVQVWHIAWLKGQPSPMHRHIYDLLGVYYEPGDRIIISPEGTRRPVSTRAWDTVFQREGVTHIEEGVSDPPLRAVFVELKRTGAYGADTTGTAPPFTGEGGTQRVDNERVTLWEFTRPPAVTPHRHAHDAVVVEFGGPAPKATWVARGTVHAGEGAASASRVYVYEIK